MDDGTKKLWTDQRTVRSGDALFTYARMMRPKREAQRMGRMGHVLLEATKLLLAGSVPHICTVYPAKYLMLHYRNPEDRQNGQTLIKSHASPPAGGLKMHFRNPRKIIKNSTETHQNFAEIKSWKFP